MHQLTWLHLSDWHQKGADFDRDVVRDALIKDIRERERVDPAMMQVHFVVFSGDLAFDGKSEEFEAARRHLLDPLMEATGLDQTRLFFVPGNHDLNRDTFEMLPAELQRPLESDGSVQKWLDDKRRARTLEPFEEYRKFVSEYTGQPTPDYASIVRLDAGGTQVALLGLNSAWMNGRNKDAQGKGVDYGYTLIGEPQLHNALVQIANADLRIAVIHHPFDWLSKFDRNRVEARLGRECHFVLHGHIHDPKVNVIHGTVGDCVIIPAGASYERRTPNTARSNAYNWVHLDLETSQGVIYLRRWSDQRNEWIEDIDSYPGGKFLLDNLPKGLTKTKAHANGSAVASPQSLPLRFERERVVLEGYLNVLVRNNIDLDSGGIKQTKVQVVVPLDEIYVGLQADRDRPDVDRRVMQDELDEIKKNLEREEDPKEREKGYQIWAHHSRVIQQALEISGPREDLGSIVQRHRQAVILGDPGSGKTTLVRYLTLRLARAILAEPERLFQRQELWDESKVWKLPDLGAVRLPILLRISHYAEARQKDPDLALVDYLPRYFAGLSVPYPDELGPLLQRLLDEGRCMVLLDGLDEIIDPTDRHNIAAAIGQFAGVYRETGLPDSLERSLTFVPTLAEEGSDGHGESADDEAQVIVIRWDNVVPEEVRQGWEKQIKRRKRGWRRRDRAIRLAWELLGEARYAHVGNRFVVTSRIAGYHFAGVPGPFEHYTIRRMSADDIKRFLEKWCPAVERRIAASPEPAQVEERARRELEGILQAVETTPGVRRMAENPLLLRILAIIHRNEAHLPQRRVELYETATVTLLRDWHLERGTKGAAIDDVKATSLLGPVAFYIHENRASGFLTKGETETILARILARERGEMDPEQPSLETRQAVQHFLETVREHSGLFVERGEGLYGFMHLTFEEYFTARHLVSSSTRARSEIMKRLHLPRWREPILLAVGSLSKQFYDDTHDLLRAITDAGSAYERTLHRDLLFAASCVGDSVNVATVLRQEISGRLLTLYCDRRRSGRYRLLRQQIKDALLTLCNDQGDTAVEAALAETLSRCADRAAITSALDAVDWLGARTPAVARALVACSEISALPRTQDLIRGIQARSPISGSETRPVSAGWDAVRDDIALARVLGLIWRYGSSDSLSLSLGLPKHTSADVSRDLQPLSLSRGMDSAKVLLQRFDDVAIDPLDVKSWNAIATALQDNWRSAPAGSNLELATVRLIEAVADSLENRVDTRETARRLKRFIIDRTISPSLREGSAPGKLMLDQALALFRNLVHEQECTVTGTNFDQVFELAGSHVLKAASAGHTLVEAFSTTAARFGSLHPLPDVDILRAKARSLQSEIGRGCLTFLRSSTDEAQYREAALFLAFPSVDSVSVPLADKELARLAEEATGIVSADLESEDVARRRRALHALTLPGVCKRVPLTESQLALLLRLLDGPLDQATLALDILFIFDITPDLIAACWSVLRGEDHPLADAVREKLDGIKEVRGNGRTLDALKEGLSDPALRANALDLLHRVKWQGIDTFGRTLVWLASEDTEVRYMAALLLASQDDLLASPRAVLREVALKSVDTREDWVALREDLPVVRLLSGLWLHGWDEALTQLWVAESAKSHVNRHPRGVWSSFRTYPKSNECISWLLERAALGQGLIPAFQDAARRLGELEAGTAPETAPQAQCIALVKNELLDRIDTLQKNPDVPPLLRFEATVLSVATRNETIPPIPPEVVRAAFSDTDSVERATVLMHLARPSQIMLWLQKQCASSADDSLAAWLREVLSRHNLAPSSPPATLVHLLTLAEPDARVAAALALLASDIYALLIAALVDIAQSPDDRLRMKGGRCLRNVCGRLPTDGSTMAVETLLRFLQDSEASKDGHLGTVAIGAAGDVEHTESFWISRWLEAIRQEGPTQQAARRAVKAVYRVSAKSVNVLCGHIRDPTSSIFSRRSVAIILGKILKNDTAMRSDDTIRAALCDALNDADVNLRRHSAYALQWTAGYDAWPVSQVLLRSAKSDLDTQTRVLALRSLGCVLHVARSFRDVDVSKDALLRWLELQTKDNARLRRYLAEAVTHLPDLLPLKEASDVEAVLTALSNLEATGLTDNGITLLRASEEWHTIINSARQEWKTRTRWLATLPALPSVITEIRDFLSAEDPTIRRAAAGALARLYHGEDDRLARLRELLPDEASLLRALLDAATDSDFWVDEGKSASCHTWAVKQIATWIEAMTPEGRVFLIDLMLNDLEKLLDKQLDDENDTFTDDLDSWPARRIFMGTLAELSERLTFRAFVGTRLLGDVVTLFVRVAADAETYNARRFAIRALGNMQHLTNEVADVFFAACQDVGDVYRETRIAVTKFKAFGTGSLERLTAAIRSPSITVAYHAAVLLGELGVSRSEELGHGGRQRVADELVQLLDDTIADRMVYDYTKSVDGIRLGPLYDEIYEALVRVVAGPDAPRSAAVALVQ